MNSTQKRVEYGIVSSSNMASLEDAVNWRLERGWKLDGNLVVVRQGTDAYELRYFQAMTREED